MKIQLNQDLFLREKPAEVGCVADYQDLINVSHSGHQVTEFAFEIRNVFSNNPTQRKLPFTENGSH